MTGSIVVIQIYDIIEQKSNIFYSKLIIYEANNKKRLKGDKAEGRRLMAEGEIIVTAYRMPHTPPPPLRR